MRYHPDNYVMFLERKCQGSCDTVEGKDLIKQPLNIHTANRTSKASSPSLRHFSSGKRGGAAADQQDLRRFRSDNIKVSSVERTK